MTLHPYERGIRPGSLGHGDPTQYDYLTIKSFFANTKPADLEGLQQSYTEHPLDSSDVHDVRPDADDHGRAGTASSTTSSAIQTRSAVSKVERSSPDQARHRRRSSSAVRAVVAADPSAVNDSINGSAASTSSASSARRDAPATATRSLANVCSVLAYALVRTSESNATIVSTGVAAVLAIRRACNSGAKKRC